jgi:hypothetical protein
MEPEKRTRDLARRKQEEAEKRNKYLQSLVGKEGILWKVDKINRGKILEGIVKEGK